MAFTQAQLDAIQESYARGVLEATLPDGSKVRYRSLDEMQRIITKMESQISAPRTNVAYPSHSRGYEG
jgi:hypothetical protein